MVVRGVAECAVIGVPDQTTDEAVKAFVVKAAPELSVEDIDSAGAVM